jgi:CubicO group peptidase (beta-lactamase class C family)
MKKSILYIAVMTSFLTFSSCLKDEPLNLRFTDYIPVDLDDGWIISTPEAEGMDSSIVENLYHNSFIDKIYPTLKALLIVRNGKLVTEAYIKDPDDLHRLHNLMSAAKSITSLAAGIALDQGIIQSLDTTVYHYLPEYIDSDIKKKEITIRQVLTMETGLDFDNEVHASALINHQGSSLEYVLHKNLVFDPGTDWYYGNGNPQLISGIIQKQSELSLAEFIDKNLFKPIGITEYQWESLHDGLTCGAQGLWLKVRDMAKIGWLMASMGIWEDSNIVSEDWIKLSTVNQSEYQNYGYYWYPIEDIAFYASGHGGQIIYIYPDKKLVVVIISDPYAKSYEISNSYDDLFSQIVSSIK